MHLLSKGRRIGVTLTLQLTVSSRERGEVFAQMASPMSPGIRDSSPMSIDDEPMVDHVAVDAIDDQGKSWEILLKRLELLMQLGDKLAEVR